MDMRFIFTKKGQHHMIYLNQNMFRYLHDKPYHRGNFKTFKKHDLAYEFKYLLANYCDSKLNMVVIEYTKAAQEILIRNNDVFIFK